jgi:PAS domain S-box-containing protein
MWVYDLDTLAFLAVNETAVRRYGYSREEFLGMTIKDIRPPEDIPALPENVARVGEGLDEAGIWRHQTKDGTLLEVEIVSHTLTFADRKAELVLAQDVTKRRQAEQTLRESERRLATLFRSSPDMVGIASLTEGRYLDVNDGYGRILGYSRDELIGRTIHELGIWADALPRATLVEALTRDGAVRNWEIQYRTKSGRMIVGLVSAELIDYAGAPCVLSVTRDVTERKQTEAALRESEAKLQSIFRATPAGVGVVVHRVLKAANQRLCEMVGYAEDELVNQSARLLYPTDEDFAYVGREKYAQIEATGVGTVETRWRRKDGTVLDVLLSSAPMEPDNWGAGVIFTALDITQRTRAEKALRENEERLRLALRAANQGLYDLNVQTGDAAVNEEYVRMLGYDPATFRETHAAWIERLHPDDRERCTATYQAYIAGRLPVYQVEFRQRAASGEWMWILSIGQIVERDPDGMPLRMLGTHLDITERRRAEEALRQSESRYRAFSDLTSDYVYACSRLPGGAYRLDWAGGAFDRISGYTLDDVRRVGCWLPFIHPEDRERVSRSLMDLTPGQTGTCDFRLIAADGSVRWIRETARCVPSEDQPDCWRLYGAAQDITERRRDAEERQRFEEQMRHAQKLESLGVLAGGIAHDFNNLLMAILGNADLALLTLPPASPTRQHLQEIERASRRAADLCRQMLAYSGKGRFIVERHDLSELVREMAHMLEVSVSKRATVEHRFASGLPAVEADATQVRQIVMNLMTNASEALGDRRGTITITTGTRNFHQAFLRESLLGGDLIEGEYVYLEVADTGCGMDAATRERIFDPFFTTKFAGRGLGLAAVLGIVRGHGGAIRVQSAPGQGSTFTLLFPAVLGIVRAPTRRAGAGADWQGAGTVLLVDDEEAVRTVGTWMLERSGFQVLTAADGNEALGVYRQHADAIVCVLLDLTMPGLSGEETFAELCRVNRDVRVVLSSGYDAEEIARRFEGHGPADFIQKPYTMEALRNTLRRALA